MQRTGERRRRKVEEGSGWGTGREWGREGRGERRLQSDERYRVGRGGKRTEEEWS